MIFYVLILCLISKNTVLAKPQLGGGNVKCYTPQNKTGICIPVQSCSSLYRLLHKVPLFPQERNFLQRSMCDPKQQSYVCCPQSTSRGLLPPELPGTTKGESLPPKPGTTNGASLLPEPGVCGIDTTEKIVGGEITKIDEFRWIALIEYSKPNNERGFHCGGSLISDRYVVTAAHCVTGKFLKTNKWKLSSVRLGEWDLNSEKDCEIEDKGDCADPPLDIAVEKIIFHENYNSDSKLHENDIALLRLSRSVNYTDYIKPICLPKSENLRTLDYEGIELDVAGWGRTERAAFSNLKLKVNVIGVSLQRCNKVYNRHNITLSSGQMCAGGKKGADACQGDSGGPLMAVNFNNPGLPYYYLAGIVSFGPKNCGTEGYPGVYTKTSSYMDWISRNIRE